MLTDTLASRQLKCAHLEVRMMQSAYDQSTIVYCVHCGFRQSLKELDNAIDEVVG